MSTYTELSDLIINLVSQYFGIDRDVINASNKQAEIVDARHVVIYLLFRQGFYPKQIANILSLSPRAICHAITSFPRRLESNKMLKNIYMAIEKELRKKIEVSGK